MDSEIITNLSMIFLILNIILFLIDVSGIIILTIAITWLIVIVYMLLVR